MKMTVHIGVDLGRARHAELMRLLAEAGCLDAYSEYYYSGGRAIQGAFWHTFDLEDPCLESLQGVLSAHGIHWVEQRDALYTSAELATFPLLALRVTRTPVRHGGGKYGTEYDFSGACPACGSGAIQTSPLVLPASALPAEWQRSGARDAIRETEAREMLVGEPLAGVLRTATISGLELRQVVSRKHRALLPWWQVLSGYEMPRVGAKTRGIGRERCWTSMYPTIVFPPPCTSCRRDGHYRAIAEPLQIVYDRNDLLRRSIPEVARTWEWFGHSVRQPSADGRYYPGYAQPLILIGQKMFGIIRELKVRGLRFDPVRIE